MEPYLFNGTPHETQCVMVCADTKEDAEAFLRSEFPLEGWEWRFDGKDKQPWLMWWFTEIEKREQIEPV